MIGDRISDSMNVISDTSDTSDMNDRISDIPDHKLKFLRHMLDIRIEYIL